MKESPLVGDVSFPNLHWTWASTPIIPGRYSHHSMATEDADADAHGRVVRICISLEDLYLDALRRLRLATAKPRLLQYSILMTSAAVDVVLE